jgi:hypothetical protein
MVIFKSIKSGEDIREVIKSAFSIELSIEGDWGYSEKLSTIIRDINMPLRQLQHTIASMRTHIEMSMTLPKEQRYAGINLSEKSREEYRVDGEMFQKVTYEVSAIAEESYKEFISEYKEGYGKEEFDMGDHFERKAKATLKREIEYWFEVSRVNNIE